jgi:hypothetical protein
MIDLRVAQHIGMDEVRKWCERRGNRAALVMGGGPSLPADFELVMDSGLDPFLISVKQHALVYLMHREGMTPDACCFLENPDDPDQAELRLALLVAPEVYLVSPFDGWTNAVIDEPWWQGGFSSTLAVWFAAAAGFEQVLLAGMDCYQGPRKYWYDRPGYTHPCFDSPLENHLAAWRPAFERVPHADRIRAVSGPLVEVFGRWLP